jgi:hypothetical protein
MRSGLQWQYVFHLFVNLCQRSHDLYWMALCLIKTSIRM